MTAAPLQEYYRALGETDRLSGSPLGRLEFDRTRELLLRHLPPGGPGTLDILDVGGATGVHARWLAALGHRVEVVDPVAEQVAVAATVPGVTARVGDARELERADRSCDVVLLLGPLYHLPERADRVRVLAEARRVVRPGGLVAAATIARHASLLDLAALGRLTEQTLERVRPTVAHGRHDPALGFTDAYFARVGDVAEEFAAASLPGAVTYGVEGPGFLALRGAQTAAPGTDVPPALYDAVALLARESERDPALQAVGSHLLTVVVA